MASFAVWIRSFRVISTAASLLVLLTAVGNAARAQTAHFLGAQIPLPIGTLVTPYGMAVGANGNIYVAVNANNSLSKLTPSGALSSGAAFLSGDGSPYGIAVDGAGNLFVSDNLKNEVAKETLQPGGYYKKSVLPLKGLNRPMGVAVDGQGNVYVADSQNNWVIKGHDPDDHAGFPKSRSGGSRGRNYVTVRDTYDALTIPQGTVIVTDTVGSQVTTLNGGGAVGLSNGEATLTMVPGVAGTHTITAHYDGGYNGFLASTAQVSLTVQQ